MKKNAQRQSLENQTEFDGQERKGRAYMEGLNSMGN